MPTQKNSIISHIFINTYIIGSPIHPHNANFNGFDMNKKMKQERSKKKCPNAIEIEIDLKVELSFTKEILI